MKMKGKRHMRGDPGKVFIGKDGDQVYEGHPNHFTATTKAMCKKCSPHLFKDYEKGVYGVGLIGKKRIG